MKDGREDRWMCRNRQENAEQICIYIKSCRWNPTHHADGPDWHEAVTPVAVGPGVPARVLSLLQNEHLAGQVLLLITHPAGKIGILLLISQEKQTQCCHVCGWKVWWLTVHTPPWWSQSSPDPSQPGYGTRRTGQSYDPGSSRVHRWTSEE